MSIFNKVFGKKEGEGHARPAGVDDHLVRIHIPLDSPAMASPDEIAKWSTLEEALGKALSESNTGYVDGNEIGQGEYTIFLYGPNARRLMVIAREQCAEHNVPPKAYMFVRHGGVNDRKAKEEDLPLG